MNKMVEVCCGSYYDCLQAYMGKADRVELNSALYMGGLTPSTFCFRVISNVPPQLSHTHL
ncbi:copper homeostasis protein CutC [Clostridium sp.]|uniref:copper homeostasis protein CutC n=1 Tax=Clostridium sp. TaxID=1506 RepID=UPI003D6CEA4E